ncbi:MAG TPA: phosphoglucosamine mutase [Blastocatellia bacterium]|nr:phosphoglucosamine mutase [Blastocatellia bacterium]
MPEDSGQRLFGTDGIRGVAHQYPLDSRTVALIARSLTQNMMRELGRAPAILIGRDTRESGPRIEFEFACGALAAGATVRSAGVLTTPGVAYLTRTRPFDAGVVISASHNPFQDNGIKIFAPTGKKLTDASEREIEQDIAADIESGIVIECGSGSAGWLRDQAGNEKEYQESYIDYLATDVGRGLSLSGLRLGIDCANGAASPIAPALFGRLGASVSVISADPNGRNINEGCGSLHLDGLRNLVTERGLDLGIAFDGDADRALFVDAQGRLVDGDGTLFILADDFTKRGLLAGHVLIATVMSNIGLELALNERSITLVRAPVGDRYVLEELLVRGAKLGGEQSGHIIFPDISLAGDGLITAIELLRAVHDSDRSLGELASRMTRYPQVLVNVRVRSKPPFDTIAQIKSEADRVERDLEGRGRLLLRYSGTENLARVMIEGEDEEKINEQANQLAEIIRQTIG